MGKTSCSLKTDLSCNNKEKNISYILHTSYTEVIWTRRYQNVCILSDSCHCINILKFFQQHFEVAIHKYSLLTFQCCISLHCKKCTSTTTMQYWQIQIKLAMTTEIFKSMRKINFVEKTSQFDRLFQGSLVTLRTRNRITRF